MGKLLIICGPTATGKTSLALRLAKVFNGELISADSRQVYKGVDIATGKDLPQDAKWHLAEFPISNLQSPIGYWETKNKIRIWGYDLIEPMQEFSVGQYLIIANKIIEDILGRNKLPILVGGTGLYIKGVVDGIATASIPKNIKLRKSLEEKSKEELFKTLLQLDPIKANSLNASDKKNPRRLVRAIEVAQSKIKNPLVSMNRFIDTKYNTLFVGLTASIQILSKKIEERVKKRIKQGIELEIKKLIDQGVTWDMQAMNSLGCKQWRSYFEGNESKDEVINEWVKQERSYARRQMTWFKRDKRINWFDVTGKGWQARVEKLVRRWHNGK